MSITLITPVVHGEGEPEKKENSKSRHDKIYYFQHKVLPAILFASDSVFFADLTNGNYKIINFAKDIVDEDFAKAMDIQPASNIDAYTITFQEPAQVPECYYALIIKDGTGYSYYTLERGIDMFETGEIPRVLCEWTKDEIHRNYGPREYDDLESFVNDIISMRNNG